MDISNKLYPGLCKGIYCYGSGIDAFNQKINLYNDDAMKAQWVGWGDNSDLGLEQDFADSIRERRDPAASGLDGLKAVEVTVAAYKSAKSKQRVAV